MSLHFFLNSDKFIRKTFLYICSFHGEDRFKCIFFGSKDLNFLFMIVKLIGDIFYLLLNIKLILLREFEAYPLEMQGSSRSFVLFSLGYYECFAFYITPNNYIHLELSNYLLNQFIHTYCFFIIFGENLRWKPIFLKWLNSNVCDIFRM